MSKKEAAFHARRISGGGESTQVVIRLPEVLHVEQGLYVRSLVDVYLEGRR